MSILVEKLVKTTITLVMHGISLQIYCTLDDDLSEVGVTGALLAVPNDDELLPKLPLP